MGALESVKDFYFKIEDKYYDFLDWLDARGLPVYKLVDAIESKNIPSFPVAIISVAIAAILIYLLVASLFPAMSNVTVQVFDPNSNAVSGAIVTVNYSNQTASKATDSAGKALFSVPLGAQLTGSVKKTGFKDSALDFVAEKTEFSKSITLNLEINTLTRTIQLMDKASGSLLKKEVSILFTCSDVSYSKEKTTSTGTILLDDIPKTCGTLIATPTSAFTIEQGNIDLSQSAPQLRLSEQIIEKGTVKVFLKDKQNSPAAGVTVKLLRSDGVQQQSKPSSTAGSVQFDNVPVGKYYIYTYDGYNNKFANYDTSLDTEGIKQLNKDGTIEFTIQLVEKVVGKIKVLVKDKRNNAAVPNAAVTLFKGNVSLSTQSTNTEGKVEFAASEASGYSIKVDHQSYLIELRQNISPSESFIEFLLTQATSANIQSLIVSVADQKGAPVENAKLTLKKLDGTVASDVIATGIDGNASFERIAPDTYYVYAVKEGFEGVNSSSITILERQQNFLAITLSIGSGTIEVSVLDEELKPVQGAIVKMFNSFNMNEMQRETTGTDGKKSFNVRADKRVFFVASSESYLDYTTIPTMPEAGNTVQVEIKLVKDVTTLEVELLGLFVGNDIATESLAAGQKYKAKLQLRVPSASTFSEAGVHLRTGKSADGKTNTMTADPLYISKVSAAATTMLKGTTFTPPSGYAADSKQLTSGNAKWANIVFSKPRAGVFEIEAEIVVKENAQIGSILEIAYRGWGKATSYLRYPKDKVLGESEAAGGRQALYANTLKQLYGVGPNSLCTESFCYYFSIEDMDADLLTSIVDRYDAKISGNYKLLFTLVSKEETVFPASDLEIRNDSAGLKLGDYVITGADGSKLSGTAQGKLQLAVGDIGKNSTIQGELRFKTMKEGLNALKISLKSNKENIFTKAIDVSVSAASEMKLEMLPKIIVPFIDNDIMLHVTDSNSGAALGNTGINIWLDDITIFSGETDGAGITHFTLQSPNANSLLKIEATRNGYKPIIKEVRVTQNILTVTPEEISELLTTTGILSIERDVHLRNDTDLRLKLDGFGISEDFNGLVNFSMKENYAGTDLPQDTDKNVFLIMELTDEGKRVEEITKLKGVFSIFVSNSDLQRTWVVNIPLKIRIGFGKEVSDDSCLAIEPVEWKAFTGKKQIEQRFTLRNNCRVEKTAIALRAVQVKIDLGKEQSLGAFVATSSLENSNTVRLSNTFTILAPMIGAGAEETLTISFSPDSNVIGGESKPNIVVKAINPTEEGPEELTAKIAVDVMINDLEQCIEIKKANNLRINTCPYGTGFGNYMDYGYGGNSYYGAQSNRFASPFQYGDTAFAGYPEQLYQQHYPYSGFSDPFYDSSYLGTGTGMPGRYNSFQCGTTRFTIANNCASQVQIDLEVDPALQVAEQTFDLDPAGEKEVTIEASYFIGIYPINVLAKVKESKEKSTPIKELFVTVQALDDPSQYRDCIKLDKTKFNFNDFLQKPVTGRVFNTCFAQGVRLDYDSVRFSQSAYGERYPMTEGTTLGRGSGMGLIADVQVIDLTTRAQANNKITQVLEFELYKNIDYRREEGFPRAGTPFSQLGDLRGFISGAYNRVEAPAILIVNYTSPIGGQQSRQFHVTIEDLWNLLGTLEGLNLYGNPNVPAQGCIMENALEFGKDCLNEKFGNNNYFEETRDVMRVGDYRPQTAYNQDVYSKAQQIMAQNPGMQYAQALEIAKSSSGTSSGAPTWAPGGRSGIPGSAQGPMGTQVPGGVPGTVSNVCGTTDRLTLDEGFNIIEQDGVVITLTVVPSKNPSFLGTMGGMHSIKVSIDRSKSTKAGPIEINKRLSATVYRQTPLGAQKVEIPFHVCAHGLGKETISEKAKKCADRLKEIFGDLKNVPREKIEEQMKILPECQGLTEAEKAEVLKFIGQVTTPTLLKCADGSKSGTAALAEKGFEKLPFTWQFGKIEKTTCDKGSKYCDAVQHLIALAKKTKDAKAKIDSWQESMESTNTENVKAAMGTGEVKDEIKDTKNIYRWAFKQRQLKNLDEETPRVFFLGKDNRILSAPIKAEGELKTALDAAKTALASNNLDQMEPLLAEIEKDEKLKKDFVVEIEIGKTNGITAESKLPDNATKDTDYLKEQLKADTVTGNDKLLVLTFEEFKAFHEAVENACGSWNACKATDKKIIVFGKELDKGFFGRFLNSVSFKRGIRDTAELSIDSTDAKFKEDLDIVLEKAATITGIDRRNFEAVWKDISSTALLASDGYTEQLQSDFKEYYLKKASSEFQGILEFVGNKEKFSFKIGDATRTDVDAGQYSLFLNYNFASGNAEERTMNVEMKKIGEPEDKVKDNWFLYNPIDGQVSGANGRLGYGIGFSSQNDSIVIVADGTNPEDRIVGAKGGLKMFEANIDSSLATASTGKVLDASSVTFKYSPSSAFKLEMKLQGAGTKTALYNITDNGKPLPSVGTLINWDNAKERAGVSPQECGSAGTNLYFGVSSATDALKAAFFVPATTKYILALWCAKESATLTATEQGIGQKELSSVQTISATPAGREQSVALPQRPKTVFEIKQFIDAVKEGKVCIDTTKDKLSLSWNPETITGATAAQPASSSPPAGTTTATGGSR